VGRSGARLFLSQFWHQYHTTGAIWPSGQALARELAYYVANPLVESAVDSHTGRKILEVGPGTGTVTCAILSALQPEDQVTLVEINPQFVNHLRERLKSETAWQRVAERVTIRTEAIQDFAADDQFDVIVSGLPLNNFSVQTVESILAGLDRLAKPSATVSFFEYIAIRHFKAVVSGRAERKRLRGVAAALDKFLGKRELRRRAIVGNMPPAWAHHVQRSAEPSEMSAV
jgi:phosphatidylethanolamine/phosphatidyl-N-methylethanolamine N-methyltransferase